MDPALHREVWSPSRRTVLKATLGVALASQLEFFDRLVVTPERPALAAGTLPNIQFDIGNFIAPAQTLNGVQVRFGPVFVLFAPARLNRTPSRADQTTLANALNTIESVYPFSPSGAIVHIAYGVPYFNRLNQTNVANNMPRLLSNNSRFALEEAVPAPTDVVPGNGITKKTFNVPVRIESNDVVFMIRSDQSANTGDVLAWLQGSNRLNGQTVASPAFGGLFSFQTTRLQFTQLGMPRLIASNQQPSPTFLDQIPGDSPMWMGFTDQQVNASGPAQIVTFEGNSTARLTNATSSSYFANGSIMHLSHNIEDLPQFYSRDPAAPETYQERVQYMFRSNQLGTVHGIPSEGNTDQFANGGGPFTLNNVFQGTDAAMRGARASGGVFQPGNQTLDATFLGANRIGHEAALQRSSRAADGTPIHIRMDGPGFDGLDVPGGANTAKLQFAVFVPTAEFFRVMRVNQAALDLQNQFLGGDDEDNGLERFITATRRQNFLVPPRVHRSFPLRELQP
ncbi:MAG TPA: hypothetical protein VOB72_00030 [Candidatus Dormibacteraeota bacterium]|nr:hypothetical protein [Candidatus Dormibacteraeota bacterium]